MSENYFSDRDENENSDSEEEEDQGEEININSKYIVGKNKLKTNSAVLEEEDEDQEDLEEELEDEEDDYGIQKGGVEDIEKSDEDADIVEDDDDDESIDLDIDEEEPKNVSKKIKQIPLNVVYNNDEEEDDDEDGETYLKKFDKDIQRNYIMNFHPECILHNYDEIATLTNVVRDKDGIIIDDLHRTLPYLTKYERTRILGQRAKQIDSGATAFVKVPENVIEGYLIALLELQQKRIPFIIRRPLPNGGSEYWNVKDLENISF